MKTRWILLEFPATNGYPNCNRDESQRWIGWRRIPTVTKEVERFEEDPGDMGRRRARRCHGDSGVMEEHKYEGEKMQDPRPTVMLKRRRLQDSKRE